MIISLDSVKGSRSPAYGEGDRGPESSVTCSGLLAGRNPSLNPRAQGLPPVHPEGWCGEKRAQGQTGLLQPTGRPSPDS